MTMNYKLFGLVIASVILLSIFFSMFYFNKLQLYQPQLTTGEFDGLTDSQIKDIKHNRFTCAKSVDRDDCMKKIDEKTVYYRQQNQKVVSDQFDVKIDGLNKEYDDGAPIVFSIHTSVKGTDCVTLVTLLEKTGSQNSADALTTRLICDPQTNDNSFSDDYKFNTEEKTRTLDKGQYKITVLAKYYVESKTLAEREFVIN